MYLSIAHFNPGCHHIFSDSFGPWRLRVNPATFAHYSLSYFPLGETLGSPQVQLFALTSKLAARTPAFQPPPGNSLPLTQLFYQASSTALGREDRQHLSTKKSHH